MYVYVYVAPIAIIASYTCMQACLLCDPCLGDRLHCKNEVFIPYQMVCM